MNRVVITGAGIYSSIGKNLDEVKTPYGMADLVSLSMMKEKK